MERTYDRSSWDVIGASIQGPYHKNKGIPNQDAIGWHQKKPGKLPIILSIADGLGDEMFFRSDRGSRFAVEASIETCKRHIWNIRYWDEDLIRNNLLRKIIATWLRKIDEDLVKSPFSSEELQSNTKHGQYYLSKIQESDVKDPNKFIRAYPYSTTLNTIIFTKEFLIMIQVGDGDIVVVMKDGSTREIFPRDLDCGRVIPLSYPHVENSCNVCMRSIRKEKPLIIYVSSDGYSAGYDLTQFDFNEIVAFEFHSKIQDFGIGNIQKALPSLLEDISQGSFDDISLGIIVGPQNEIKETALKLKKLNNYEQNGRGTSNNEQDTHIPQASAVPNNNECIGKLKGSSEMK